MSSPSATGSSPPWPSLQVSASVPPARTPPSATPSSSVSPPSSADFSQLVVVTADETSTSTETPSPTVVQVTTDQVDFFAATALVGLFLLAAILFAQIGRR